MRQILIAISTLAAVLVTADAQMLDGSTLANKVESAYKKASYDDLSKLIVWHLDPSLPSSKEAWDTTTRNQMKQAEGKNIRAEFYTIAKIGSTNFKDVPVPQLKEPVLGYVIVIIGSEENSWYPWAVIQTPQGARLVAAPWKQTGEQGGTGQPATRPAVEPQGSDKPQPEAEGRSR